MQPWRTYCNYTWGSNLEIIFDFLSCRNNARINQSFQNIGRSWSWISWRTTNNLSHFFLTICTKSVRSCHNTNLSGFLSLPLMALCKEQNYIILCIFFIIPHVLHNIGKFIPYIYEKNICSVLFNLLLLDLFLNLDLTGY